MCVTQVHILDDAQKGDRGWPENASPLKMAVEELPLGLLLEAPTAQREIGEKLAKSREPSAGSSEGQCKPEGRGWR